MVAANAAPEALVNSLYDELNPAQRLCKHSFFKQSQRSSLLCEQNDPEDHGIRTLLYEKQPIPTIDQGIDGNNSRARRLGTTVRPTHGDQTDEIFQTSRA